MLSSCRNVAGSVAPIETSPGVQCGSAAVITIINIIIIWTLGGVLSPGTRSGSGGEAVIKTISFNSAAVRSRETGHATQWQDVRLWRVEQLSCRLCPEIAVIVVMNVDPGCGADSRTEDLLAVLRTIHRFHNRFSQSRRRPLLVLSHLRHY